MKKVLLSLMLVLVLSVSAFAGATTTFGYNSDTVISSDAVALAIPFSSNRQITGTYINVITDDLTAEVYALTLAATTGATVHVISAAVAVGGAIISVESSAHLSVGDWIYLKDRDIFENVELHRIEFIHSTVAIEIWDTTAFAYAAKDLIYEMQANSMLDPAGVAEVEYSNDTCLVAESVGQPVGLYIDVAAAGRITAGGYYGTN